MRLISIMKNLKGFSECKKRFCVFSIVLVFSLLMMADAYAFGIATNYGSETVNIPIAQKTADWSFRLQNMENGELPVIIAVTSDGNIARLLNSTSVVLMPNTTNNAFIVELDLPADAKNGDSYNVTVYVNGKGNETGQVVMGQGIGKTFTVNAVGENPPVHVPPAGNAGNGNVWNADVVNQTIKNQTSNMMQPISNQSNLTQPHVNQTSKALVNSSAEENNTASGDMDYTMAYVVIALVPMAIAGAGYYWYRKRKKELLNQYPQYYYPSY
jgi:hypothetical protein